MSLEEIRVIDQLEQDILAWRRTDMGTGEFTNRLYVAWYDFNEAEIDKDDL